MRGKIFFQKFLYIFIIIVISYSASGCTRNTTPSQTNGNTKTEIYTWRSTEYKDLFRTYAGQFMTNNKNVQIWYNQQDLENYEFRTINAIASDQKPQVWSIPVDWMPDNLDKLVPMPEGMLGEKVNNAAFMRSKLISGANNDIHDSIIYNNKVYGLPFVIDSLLLYYNPALFSDAFNRWLQAHPRDDEDKPSTEELRIKTLLSQPPSTWQELLDIVPLLTIREGNVIRQSAIALGTSDNIANADDIVQLMIYQNGGDIVSDEVEKLAVFKASQVKENGEIYYPGREALSFYTSFSNSGKENYSWNKSMPNSREAFAQGKVAMVLDYPILRDQLEVNQPDFKYKATTSIQISDSEPPVNFGTYSVETVTKAANTPLKIRYAWAWILSYMKTESSQSITEVLMRPSPHKSISEVRAKASLGTSSRQAFTVRVPYKRHHQEFDATFIQMIKNVAEHGQAVDDAINQANDKINALLRKP